MARGNGEGSIYQRKDGRWCGSVTIGYKIDTGNQKRKYVYGKSRKEVADKINEILHKVNTETYVEATNLTVGDWLDKWLSGRKPHLAYNTWDSYEMLIRCHIKPVLGSIQLKKLNTRHIQAMLNDKLVNGRIKGEGGLSPRTVRYMHTVLHSALDQAVKECLIVKNVAAHVELPKKDKKEMDTYNKDQVKRLLNAAKGKDITFYMAILLELTTGLRKGEILALKWENIDLEKGTLQVKEQLQRVKDEGLIFKEPKTKKSKRSIALSEKVVSSLKYYKSRQNERRLILGTEYKDFDLVICQDNGKPFDPVCFIEHYKSLLKEAGLPDSCFHSLRHTFATLSLEAGVSIKAIQDILGHSSISTTMDVYSHVTQGMKKEAADTISNVVIENEQKNKSLSKKDKVK